MSDMSLDIAIRFVLALARERLSVLFALTSWLLGNEWKPAQNTGLLVYFTFVEGMFEWSHYVCVHVFQHTAHCDDVST